MGADLEFNFDQVFQEEITQSHIFDLVAKPTVKSLLDGSIGSFRLQWHNHGIWADSVGQDSHHGRHS